MAAGEDTKPEATADAQAKADLADVPKIPYSRGLRLSGREIMRIAMLIGTLVLLLTMQGPCSQAVSSFVSDFGSNTPPPAKPAPDPKNLVHLPPGQTDQQMKQTIDQARAGSGSAATP